MKMAKMPVFFFVFLLAATDLRWARSARMLDEVEETSQPQVAVSPPLATIPSPTASRAPQVGPGAAPTSGQIPTTTTFPTTSEDEADSPVPETNAPVAMTAPVAGPVAEEEEADATATAPVAVAPVTGTPTSASPTGSVPATRVGATAAQQGPQSAEPLSFFMHDILGGSHPSARVVTGIIANSDNNGIAFSKPNDNLFPVQGGVPLINNDNINDIVNNNNNIPFLAGLNGAAQGSNLLLQNSANNGVLNGGDNQPFVTAGQLPSRATLQQLMFGSVTVVDDELTEGRELGSAVIGRAQGFYMASSLDGTSQTVALTALFHSGGHEHDQEVHDTISFFGVHRTATPESQIAVIGGTGKYENAKGYATVETLHHQEDQHTTDGLDTIVHFSVYLSAE